MGSATVAEMAEAPPDATRIAAEARDRVRFEEEALAQLGAARPAADLVQRTVA